MTTVIVRSKAFTPLCTSLQNKFTNGVDIKFRLLEDERHEVKITSDSPTAESCVLNYIEGFLDGWIVSFLR